MSSSSEWDDLPNVTNLDSTSERAQPSTAKNHEHENIVSNVMERDELPFRPSNAIQEDSSTEGHEPDDDGDKNAMGDIRDDPVEAAQCDTHGDRVEKSQRDNIQLIDLVPFEEMVVTFAPGESEFSRFVYERPYVHNQLAIKSKEDPQKLIALEKRDSEISKEFTGTQWKNSQFFLQSWGNNAPMDKFLPLSWIQKETGVSMRVKIRGANVARKLVLEFTVHHDSKPQHKAFLEFHAAEHVLDYEWEDKTVKDFRPRRKGKKREEDTETLERDSFLIVRFNTEGGIGFGLNFDAEYLDQEDREVLWYARHLAKNFSNFPDTMKRVVFRMNARWVQYAEGLCQSKRKVEEWERLQRQVQNFAADPKMMLAPYRNIRGVPITQWGMFVKRSIIAQESNGLVAFPAQTSFSSLDEARIIMAYGSFLEYQREVEISQAISNVQHGVAFIKLTNSTILALAKLHHPENVGLERWSPREGTVVKIGFRPPNKMNLGELHCTAVATPDVFGLPYQGGSLFFIPGVDFKFYSKFTVEVGQRLCYFPARLKLRVPHKGTQRQVDAINRLCEPRPHLVKWSNVLLKQHAGCKEVLDPTACLNVAAESITTRINETLSIIEWSESQANCIRALREFPDGVLLIQGFPGTGKTLTLVAMASILLNLGAHVLFTAPTHFAADAICETIDKWEEITGQKLNPVRVYRPVSESKAFRTHGRPKGDRANEENLDEIDPDEFTTANVSLNHPDAEDENFVPQTFSTEAQMLMAELVKSIKEESSTKSYGLAAKSLHAHVIRTANDPERTLIARYPSEEQLARSKGELFDELESGALDAQGAEVDMLAEIRRYIEMLKEKSFREFEEQDKRKALLAFQKASHMVVREARLVVSTNNNTGDNTIASNFGTDALGIVVIRDEDTRETEANSWVPVTKLLYGERICGVVSCGDEKQLRPTVISLQENVTYNEFGPQMGLPMATRLVRMGHPVLQLTEQFRYRPTFTTWPNIRTYDGLLKSHESTTSITINSRFVDALKEVFEIPNATSIDLGNVVASVDGSLCMTDDASKSRYNDQHRLVILRLILANKKYGGYPSHDITIICPYQAQVVRLRQSLFKMEQYGLLKASEIPKVATTDSMQGKEAKVIIYDWVVSDADKLSDLGFTVDDHRGTVGLTRMKEVLISLLPESVGTGMKAIAPAERNNYLGERIASKMPYPCEFMKWAQSEKIVFPVKCPAEEDVIIVPTESITAPYPAEEDVTIVRTESITAPRPAEEDVTIVLTKTLTAPGKHVAQISSAAFSAVKAAAAYCMRALRLGVQAGDAVIEPPTDTKVEDSDNDQQPDPPQSPELGGESQDTAGICVTAPSERICASELSEGGENSAAIVMEEGGSGDEVDW